MKIKISPWNFPIQSNKSKSNLSNSGHSSSSFHLLAPIFHFKWPDTALTQDFCSCLWINESTQPYSSYNTTPWKLHFAWSNDETQSWLLNNKKKTYFLQIILSQLYFCAKRRKLGSITPPRSLNTRWRVDSVDGKNQNGNKPKKVLSEI